MRVFQNIHLYPQHVAVIDQVAGREATHAARVGALINEGMNGTHLLAPVVERSADAFLTSTADLAMQRAWATEHGMRDGLGPHDILLAQLEEFKPDVFYTQSAGAFPQHILDKLKSVAPVNIAWQASQDPNQRLSAFDRVVCNFPSYFDRLRAYGAMPAWFAPSYDPAMDDCMAEERDIDILFIGSWSRHHLARAKMLETIAKLRFRYNVQIAVSIDKAARIAATPLGLIPPLNRYRVPGDVLACAIEPQFGKNMYRQLGRAKLVVNSAIDISGQDRGNIRCFEVLGCGAALVTDAGNYPPGMVAGETMITYDTVEELPAVIDKALENYPSTVAIAQSGAEMIRERYSKRKMWHNFKNIVEQCA